MKLRSLVVAGATALLFSLAGAGSASAAAEFGDTCIGNNDFSTTDVTFFESAAATNPLPVAAPSAGVITKWKVNVVPVPFPFSQTIKLLRLDTAAHTALVVAETSVSLQGGANVIDTRTPVQAGDRLSLFGASETVDTLICTTTEENLIGGFVGNGGGVGSSNPYIEQTENFRIPIAAVIEPDADNDGYGDETQDQCPQSAAVQAACPVTVLDSFAVPGKGKVVVLVGTSTEVAVAVSATAKLPRRAKPAGASASAKLKKVTKTVTPGKIARFVLKFPASLKQALADLAPGKKLAVKVTATAANLVGPASKDKTTLKLKGTS